MHETDFTGGSTPPIECLNENSDCGGSELFLLPFQLSHNKGRTFEPTDL